MGIKTVRRHRAGDIDGLAKCLLHELESLTLSPFKESRAQCNLNTGEAETPPPPSLGALWLASRLNR